MRLSLSIGLCLAGQRRILSTLSQFWLLEATLANTFWESGFLLLSPHGPSLLFLPLKVFFTIIRKKAANSKSKTGGKISQWSKEAFPESQGNPATLLFLQKRICEPQPFAFQFFLFISKLINFIPQVLARYQVCFKVSVLQENRKQVKMHKTPEMTPEVIAVTKDNDTTCFSPEISLTTQPNLHTCVYVSKWLWQKCCAVQSEADLAKSLSTRETNAGARWGTFIWCSETVLRETSQWEKPQALIGAEQSGGGQHPERRPWGLLNMYLQLGDLTWDLTRLNNNENVLNATNLYTKKWIKC